MIEATVLQQAVGNWLWSVAKDLIASRRHEAWPDFELNAPGSRRVLLEVKSKAPSGPAMGLMAKRVLDRPDASADTIKFILATPDGPSSAEMELFESVFAASDSSAEWVALADLPELLGQPSPGPWDSPATWAALQTTALLKGLEEYRSAPIGPEPYAGTEDAGALQPLVRQLRYRDIAWLHSQPGSIDTKLGFGQRQANVTVVLSDIVNFSSLVTASRPDDLREAMSDYYLRARDAVFRHHGMLDKFIGDAVLAVFGYPRPSSAAPCDAIRFAQELVSLGRDALEAWQAELNAVIPTGTRVGIANGDIWPINIGKSGTEISLLGDTINLAARLEKNCVVDKVLLDNRTHTAARRENPGFVNSLSLNATTIAPSDAKGQTFPIQAWSIP